MNVVESIEEIRSLVGRATAGGKSVGFVPTMGALHEGHFSLIDSALRACDFVVVSIFVNPAQFGPNEDFAAYPRPLDADLSACRERNVDAVFAPSVETMYPSRCETTVTVAELGCNLCGLTRPGHFAGVCTVVAKLFNIVRPDKAFFGAKDFQQAAVIKRMVEDLNVPVEIVLCPTVREADGLAISSRNVYLDKSQRAQAPALHGALKLAEQMIRRTRPPAEDVIAAMRSYLSENAPDGIIDYVEIVDPEELTAKENTDRVLIALAVKFSRTRLIDNVLIDVENSSD